MIFSYPEIKIDPHVFEQPSHHSSQVDDMGGLMLLKHCPCLLHVPEEGQHTQDEDFGVAVQILKYVRVSMCVCRLVLES